MSSKLKARNIIYSRKGTANPLESVEKDAGVKRALNQYNDLMSYMMSQVNLMKIAVIASFVLVVIAFITLVWAFNLPQTEYVVIGVDQNGVARYFGKNDTYNVEEETMIENVIHRELTEIIEATRSITRDGQKMYDDMMKAEYYLSIEMVNAMEDEINSRDMFSQVGKKIVRPEIETMIRLSELTFQVDWFDVEYSLYEKEIGRTKYRGVFTLNRITKEEYARLSDEERHKNPLGYYVIDYRIVKV